MNLFSFKPAKMLICIVGRHRGKMIVAAAKAAGARGGTISLGHTTGTNAILNALSLADVQEDIVFILLHAEKEKILRAVRQAAQNQPKKLNGTALILNLSGMSMRNRPDDKQENTTEGEEIMDSGFELINVIINAGYGEEVMATAREAGAGGGTILNACGTGTEEDVKFFGITLVPEKDLLMIVAKKEKVGAIVEAIGKIPKLTEPGGGIIYTMNVEQFVTLGQ